MDYPNLWAYAREIYQLPGVAETGNLDHITRHYYRSHETINPRRIVPTGPEIDWLRHTAAPGFQPPDTSRRRAVSCRPP